MTVFNPYIEKVSQYVGDLKGKGRQVRERFAFSNSSSQSIPMINSNDTRSGASIVLKSDTFVELGSPSAGSCAIALYSNQPELIKDGEITLIGPDINEAPSKELPFAQIIITGGEDLNDQDYYFQLQSHNGSDKIKGVMVNSTQENIWCRISNEAVAAGFNFEVLGTVIIKDIKAVWPHVRSAEVIFITSGKADVLDLNKIGIPVREAAKTIKERLWKDRGVDIYECTPGRHCGACSDKEVCDEIRKMANEYHRISQ